MLKYLILICLLMCGSDLPAQEGPDTLARPDTVRRNPVAARPRVPRRIAAPLADTLPVFLPNVRMDTIAVAKSTPWQTDTFSFSGHPYFSFQNPTRYTVSVRQWVGKEAIFYTLVGLLLIFALIKNGFHRYIDDLFKIFFRTSVRQRQIKDQLMQNPLPSLLLNVFFVLSLGMFLALLLPYFGLALHINFWLLFLYCVLGLVAIYLGKYLTLKVVGWLFQVSDAMETYIFIVFTTNKVIGMVLLPFLVVMAFGYGSVSQVATTLSVTVLVALFAYRYFLSYVSIHRQVKISFFHFLLYLCAFEIAPLLLINKLLFRILQETS